MGAHDGGVDHHVFVVVIARQQLENALENAAFRPSAEALVHDLPVTETRRKITPGDSRSVSVKNGFDEQPIVRRIAADMAFTADRFGEANAPRRTVSELFAGDDAIVEPAMDRRGCDTERSGRLFDGQQFALRRAGRTLETGDAPMSA